MKDGAWSRAGIARRHLQPPAASVHAAAHRRPSPPSHPPEEQTPHDHAAALQRLRDEHELAHPPRPVAPARRRAGRVQRRATSGSTWRSCSRPAKFDAIFFADVVGPLRRRRRRLRRVRPRRACRSPATTRSVLVAGARGAHRAPRPRAHARTSLQSIRSTSPGRSRRSTTSPTAASPGTSSPDCRTTARATSATPRLTDHDERYAWAEEYVDVTYKLWEGSWDDGALLKDRERGVYSDASKIHKINHESASATGRGPAPAVAVAAAHAACSSRPARRASGRDFAARNAEAQFIIVADAGRCAEQLIEDTRRLAVEARAPPRGHQVLPGPVASSSATPRRRRRRRRPSTSSTSSSTGTSRTRPSSTRPAASTPRHAPEGCRHRTPPRDSPSGRRRRSPTVSRSSATSPC